MNWAATLYPRADAITWTVASWQPALLNYEANRECVLDKKGGECIREQVRTDRVGWYEEEGWVGFFVDLPHTFPRAP